MNCISTDTEGALVEVLKALKHQQLWISKEENITAPVTSHRSVDLHKKNGTEHEQRDVKKHKQPLDYFAVQPSYRTRDGTAVFRKCFKEEHYQRSFPLN